MEIAKIITFLAILSLIIFITVRSNNSSAVKKIIPGILCFIGIFIAYYFVVSFITAIPLYFIEKHSINGTDSGLWAYALIAGFTLSPILSFITTFKIMKKK